MVRTARHTDEAIGHTGEENLLQRAKRLEQDALAEIYDTYSTPLYRYALRQLGDGALAEDCVAETFGRFLRTLHRRRGPRRYLRAYLYRIAHNWISDAFRARPEDPLPPGGLLPSAEEEGPAAAVARGDQVAALRSALAQLTPAQRQVIALKYLEGWDNWQVARALRKPVGAVKSLQHRALASLRRLLAIEDDTP